MAPAFPDLWDRLTDKDFYLKGRVTMDAKVLIFKCTRVNQPIGVRVQRMEDGDCWRTWAFKISSQIASNEGYDRNQIQGNSYATEGYPGCPHCGTDGFVQCGRSCWNQEKSLARPWCGFHMDEIVPATDKFSVRAIASRNP